MTIFDAITVLLVIGGLFYIFDNHLPVKLWITAYFSGVTVKFLDLVFMRIRNVNPHLIVSQLITATKAGISVTSVELETHVLAGGNIRKVIKALISSQKANIQLSFQEATAIDLAGRDVYEAVVISVKPQVINTPKISAVASDGIELHCKAIVTVRINIRRLVGGAWKETILARVGEGIVSCVGSSHHSEILKMPEKISKNVIDKGLDKGTAFEILSIDIADIDVGKNVRATLEKEKAEADKKIGEANAAKRHAMAKAKEQEMCALYKERQAEVVQAEKDTHLAYAYALRHSLIKPEEYLKHKNIMADTSMRESVGKKTKKLKEIPDKNK